MRKNGRGGFCFGYKIFSDNNLQSISKGCFGLFIDPSNKDCVGQGKDGEENKVGADPIFTFWERCREKRGNPSKEGQACQGEGNREKKKLGEGVCPATDGINRSSVVPQGSKPEKVSPGMKGYKVGADGKERGCEVKKEK